MTASHNGREQLLDALLVERYAHPVPEARSGATTIDGEVWDDPWTCARRRRVLLEELTRHEQRPRGEGAA